MALNIETRTRALITDPWGDWVTAVDTSDLTDTDLVEYRMAQVYDVDYVSAYGSVYEQLVETSMVSQTEGKDSILTKQFELLDNNGGHLTLKEIVAAKNAAYSNLRAQIMTNSQKTAMALVDKSYKFSKELEQQDKQLALMGHQVDKAAGDAAYVAAQKTAMEEQVVDNRRIKALDSLADTYGTAMAGGIKVTTEMWTTYFDIVTDLAVGVSNPGTSTVVERVP